jgi:hypothetical protein
MMKTTRPVNQRMRTALIATTFAAAFVLATAPAWRQWVLGFNPSLDQVLQFAICGGGPR